MEYGREVVDGFAGGGELPIAQRGAPGAALGGAEDEAGHRGLAAEEDGEQGEQEVEQGRRDMDAIHHLRHAAEGVGFVRSGDRVWHHRS